MQSFLLKTLALCAIVFSFIFTNYSSTSAAEKERGIMGFKLDNLKEELVKQYKITAKKGVVVAEVFKGLPAEKAGFKAGDVVIKIGKNGVDKTQDLPMAISKVYAGDVLEITFLRGKKKMVKKLTLVPAPQQNPMTPPPAPKK